MRFVHAADLHLDSPLRGLARYEGAPEERIRGASRRALTNLVDLCLDEAVDLLVIAGDLYDGDWRDYSTGLFFASQMARLREQRIGVVVIRGNHDAASQISRHLVLPDNVMELSTRAPETRVLSELQVAVHGQSFAERVVTDDLAAGYPEPVPGMFNIGVLHTALSGRAGHEPYAPCNLETLKAKGYDYWALGHVHRREVLCQDPPVVFPGNLQGRHVREPGAKGATLVTVRDGCVVEMVHRDLDVVRFEVCEVDLAAVSTREEALDRAHGRLSDLVRGADGRLLCVRVVFVGSTGLHMGLHSERERLEMDMRVMGADFGGDLWLEKVLLRTAPPPALEALRAQEDALGQVLGALAQLRENREALGELAELFVDLKRKLPLELRVGEDGLRLEDPDFFEEVLGEVEPLLLARLLGEEGDA